MKDHLVGKRRALDVGSGSGYLTVCMAKMMDGGFVYGLEHIEELNDLARKNIRKNH